MRFAISSIAARGGWRKAREICVFVRNCRAGFEALSPNVKGLQEKQKATTTSLRKIEDGMPLDLCDSRVPFSYAM